MGMIDKLYGRHYEYFPISVKPADAGHAGASRSRVYIILAHREKVVLRYDPQGLYDSITKAVTRMIQTEPRDYLIADSRHLRLESEYVARLRRKSFRPNATCPCV